MFPLLGEIFIAANVNQKVIFDIISPQLRVLDDNLNNYFPENEDLHKGNLCIDNSFLEDVAATLCLSETML